MARGLDWRVLLGIGCAACANNMPEDASMMGAAPTGMSTAPAMTAPTSGGAGMASAPVTPTMTVTTPMTSSAGAKAPVAAATGGAGAAATAPAAAGSMAPGAAAGSSAPAIAGSGAAGSGTATSGAAGSVSEEGASSFKRPCIAKGNEVVFIGDSYSDYPIAHASLASFMQTLAVKDGALMQGDYYRNLAVAGTTLGDTLTGIPSQWEGTKAMKPIKVVVMDGGGNDVLIDHPECRPDGSEMQAGCKQVVQNSLDIAKKLMDSMKESGVTDVMYFWYPHIPGGALTGFETANSISDYTYPMLEDVAKAASTDTFHVYMVPMVEVFENHPEYFYSDGLHANDVGEGKIAEEIWGVMKENCIGQAVSSGCCMP